jgi:two-component system sensor histidine kinase KdpD
MKADERRDLLATVLEESQRLSRYIQNLLDMTRFGQQSFTPTREWVDLNDIVSSAVERLATTLSHVRLSVAVDPDVTLIRVHGALMEQVFVNLLDNAVAYAPEGSTIEVRARLHDSLAVIEVANTGPAIPEHEREKVFDMFHRVALGDRHRSGTGLGLAICRSIVAAHGGRIGIVDASDREATVVRIELPAAENPVGTVDDHV